MPDELDLYRRASETFDGLVRTVRDPLWNAPTPCAGWNVRALVNHVAVENFWAAELFAGATVDDVGTALDGDQLGAVPLARWDEALRAAHAAASAPDAMTRTVHLSFGDVPGAEYARQLFADHLVHSWDLAVAIGRKPRLDPDLIAACQEWFAGNEDAYRAAGVVGPRPPLPPAADELTTLLAAFGRTP